MISSLEALKTLAEEQLGIAHVEAGTNYWNNVTSTMMHSCHG